MTYIKIGETTYPAEITGKVSDRDWDGRESKAITLKMSYAQAMETFVDELPWSIVYTEGETTEEYDNSDFSVAGPVTDNRNGTVTVKMGKPTADELLAIVMGGSDHEHDHERSKSAAGGYGGGCAQSE